MCVLGVKRPKGVVERKDTLHFRPPTLSPNSLPRGPDSAAKPALKGAFRERRGALIAGVAAALDARAALSPEPPESETPHPQVTAFHWISDQDRSDDVSAVGPARGMRGPLVGRGPIRRNGLCRLSPSGEPVRPTYLRGAG